MVQNEFKSFWAAAASAENSFLLEKHLRVYAQGDIGKEVCFC